MSYKLLFWKWQAQQKLVSVMDLNKGRIIEFTADEFKNLDEDLQDYLQSVRNELNSPHWEYKS